MKFKYLFVLIMLFISTPVFAHGSSHPSCTNVYNHQFFENHAPGWSQCMQVNSAYYAEQERKCLASPACVQEREERKKQLLIFAIIITALFGLAFFMMLNGI